MLHLLRQLFGKRAERSPEPPQPGPDRASRPRAVERLETFGFSAARSGLRCYATADGEVVAKVLKSPWWMEPVVQPEGPETADVWALYGACLLVDELEARLILIDRARGDLVAAVEGLTLSEERLARIAGLLRRASLPASEAAARLSRIEVRIADSPELLANLAGRGASEKEQAREETVLLALRALRQDVETAIRAGEDRVCFVEEVLNRPRSWLQ